MLSSWISLCLIAVSLKGAKPDPEPPSPRHDRPAGVGSYGRELVESLHGQGLIKLKGTKVATTLKVEGSLISTDASAGTLEVYGSANLRDTVIDGTALIVGSIQATNTKFLQLLTINTPKATFTKSQIHSLVFKQEPSFKAKQVLELKQGSIIEGSLHFEGGKGEVIVDSTSRIAGKVTGGKVIYKN